MSAAAAGRWLLRWRGVIGALGCVPVALLGRPSAAGLVAALPVLGVGLGLRFWAAGHIGAAGRANVPQGTTRIWAGPYRLLGHPLYIGNALLVVAALVAFRPPVWLSWLVLGLFLIEYSLIVAAEEAALRGALRDSTARFGFRRALGEARTWLVAAVLYGLGWLKMLVRSTG
jgi:protein-S-isoprenylcysteine O-methyltransferase Ste14